MKNNNISTIICVLIFGIICGGLLFASFYTLLGIDSKLGSIIDRGQEEHVVETVIAETPQTAGATTSTTLTEANEKIAQNSIEISTLRDSLTSAQEKLNAIYKEYDKTMYVKEHQDFVKLMYQYEKLAGAIKTQKNKN